MLDSGLVRIPGSRPYKPSPSKEKKIREQSWDSRFHLGKIPEYNAFNDKFLQNNFPLQQKKVILGVGRIRKRKNLPQKALKSALNSKPSLLKNQVIKRLKEKLFDQWEIKRIPEAQRMILLESIEVLPAKKQSSIIVKEVEMFKQDRNYTQIVLRAIKARENSLVELRDFADVIGNATSTIKHNCVESLINLRMLGLHVVECVQAWRKNMHEYSPEMIPDNLKFFWEEQNYLAKMLTDYKFLLKTQMPNFINIQLNDPFFVNGEKQAGKIELPLPGYLIKRIKECEKVLQAEGPIRISSEITEKLSPVLSASNSKTLENLLNDEIELTSVSQYEKTILEYSKDVPQIIQDSIGKCSNVFSSASSLRYPSFLLAKIREKTVGLITLNLDSQKSVHNRILISHISALSIELFQKLAGFIINYIWNTYPCLEIRVGLIAKINEQGKYECEQAVKSVFDKLGFRWKQMIYAINEIPVQVLGIRRVEPYEVPKLPSIFSDSLVFSYACGIQKTPENIDDFCSAVGIACAYRPYVATPFGMFSEILSKSKGIPPAFKHRKDSSLESASRDLASLQLSFSSLVQMKETSISCSSLGLSWEKFLPLVHMNRKYTKITSQINIMKGNESVIYILPTEDPSYNVFIIPNEGGTQPATFQDCRATLKSMQKISEAQEIWIPDFEVKGSHFGNNIEETFVFRVATSLHPLGSYSEGPKEYDTVINSQFIFGLIHQKIDEDLEIPLYVFEVQVKDFLANS